MDNYFVQPYPWTLNRDDIPNLYKTRRKDRIWKKICDHSPHKQKSLYGLIIYCKKGVYVEKKLYEFDEKDIHLIEILYEKDGKCVLWERYKNGNVSWKKNFVHLNI